MSERIVGILMNELENNGVVRLCGKQCEFYHVDCDQVKDKFCFNSSGGGGGFYRTARQSCDNV